METKRSFLKMLIIVFLFSMCIIGCNTTTPVNYYNLGNVSENNCSFIVVSPIYGSGDDFPVLNLVKIDGQGNINQWQSPSSFFDSVIYNTKAIVRVTPGEHMFSFTFVYGVTNAISGRTSRREITVDISYNCQVNKGYIFVFTAKRLTNDSLSPVNASIKILEGDIVDIINYGAVNFNSSYTSSVREVANKTEIFMPTSADL